MYTMPAKRIRWLFLVTLFVAEGMDFANPAGAALVADSSPSGSYDLSMDINVRECPVEIDENSTSSCLCTPLDDIRCYGLNAIPKFNISDRVYHGIYIGKQNITSIPAEAFKNLKVKKIDLDMNKLGSNLFLESFDGIENFLEELSMGGCEIDSLPTKMLHELPSLKRLYLWGNRLEELPDKFLKSSFKVEELSLWGNRIGRLTGKTFFRLKFLRKLDLEDNRITELNFFMFENLTKLEVLNLGRNGISRLTDNVFSNMTNLKALSLHDNKINIVSDVAFIGLSSLVSLDCRNNELEYISPTLFSRLGNLTYLDLQNNFITHFFIDNHSQLQYLDLSRNDLEPITDRTFSPLVSLRYLYLDYNKKLTKLPKHYLPLAKLKTLSLVGCSINCDCGVVSSYYLGQLWRAGTVVWGMCASHPSGGATFAIGDPETYKNVSACSRG